MSVTTRNDLEDVLIKVAKAINGIQLSELTVAEHNIFSLLKDKGYMQMIRDEDDVPVVRSLYFQVSLVQ